MNTFLSREEATRILSQTLGFDVIPKGCAATLRYLDQVGQSYSYSLWMADDVSQAESQVFNDIKGYEEYTLNALDYGQLFLLSVLTYPEDGQPGNFIVTPDAQTHTYHLT